MVKNSGYWTKGDKDEGESEEKRQPSSRSDVGADLTA
jgi:hypothetical protein